jgi:hypothetical protein
MKLMIAVMATYAAAVPFCLAEEVALKGGENYFCADYEITEIANPNLNGGLIEAGSYSNLSYGWEDGNKRQLVPRIAAIQNRVGGGAIVETDTGLKEQRYNQPIIKVQVDPSRAAPRIKQIVCKDRNETFYCAKLAIQRVVDVDTNGRYGDKPYSILRCKETETTHKWLCPDCVW